MTKVTDAFNQAFKQALDEATDWELLTTNIETQEQEISIKCLKHETIFLSRPFAVRWRRTNCPACRREAVSRKLTGSRRTSYNKFKSNIKKNFGSGIELLTTENDYQSGTDVMQLKCRLHGVFSANIDAIRRGFGCKSCNFSRGERYIAAALDELEIPFETQKKFDTCRDLRPLPFDFWLPDFNILIEFQGRQHYESFDRWGGAKSLQEVQRRDKIKRGWCSENEIPLLEIKTYRKVKSSIIEFLSGIDKTESLNKFSKMLEAERSLILKENTKIIKKCEKIHPSLDFQLTQNFTKLKPRYISYNCPKHGVREAFTANVLKGHGCAECAGVAVSFATYTVRANKHFKNKFEYKKIHSDDFHNEIHAKCPKHGWIKIDRWIHLSLKTGCNICSAERKAPDGDASYFLTKAKKFEDNFVYCVDKYTATKKITIKCKKHKTIFQIRPADHLRSPTGGCPKCVSESRSKNKGINITVDGHNFTSISKCAQFYGIKPATLSKRLREGMSISEAVKFNSNI